MDLGKTNYMAPYCFSFQRPSETSCEARRRPAAWECRRSTAFIAWTGRIRAAIWKNRATPLGPGCGAAVVNDFP